MKKVTFILIAIFALSFGVKAQNAIGLRLGAGSASNAGFSFQMERSSTNRLEFDLDWNNFVGKDNGSWTNISLSGTYQWIFPIIDNLNWYVGPGAMLSFYDISHSGNDNDHFGIGWRSVLWMGLFNRNEIPCDTHFFIVEAFAVMIHDY